MKHSQRKIRLAWYFYDWANSAFVTSVITVFLGPYLTSVAHKSAQLSGGLFIFGVYIYPESLFSYVVSLSVLLQVLILPFVSSIADLRDLKIKLLYLFAYTGSLFTISLYILDEKTITYGVFAFMIANIFFGASIVMYNSLLVEIANPNERDKVSSIGWAFGYVGGGIVLGLNLIVIFFSSAFGISNEEAIRISFAVAGVWWLLFSFISQNLFKLPPSRINNRFDNNHKNAIKQLKDTLKNLFKNKNALLFFIAFLLFNDGVQTVIIISTQFGKRELNLSIEFLVLVILAVQFLSFFGTLLVMKINEYLKSKATLITCLIIWSFIAIYGYFFLRDEIGFVVLAILISLVLGGTQAISRSIFTNFIPRQREAEYFSFYEITEKGSSWVGPLTFGLVLQLTKSYRLAILSLILFFLGGIFFLLKVNFSEVGTGELE